MYWSTENSYLSSIIIIIMHLYKRLQLNLHELEIELNTTYMYLAYNGENIIRIM